MADTDPVLILAPSVRAVLKKHPEVLEGRVPAAAGMAAVRRRGIRYARDVAALAALMKRRQLVLAPRAEAEPDGSADAATLSMLEKSSNAVLITMDYKGLLTMAGGDSHHVRTPYDALRAITKPGTRIRTPSMPA